jgi:hypothetical protein
MVDQAKKDELARTERTEIADRPGEPPVVARLVVEIRSDGSRTIARGAMEDVQSGQTVAVEAKGSTPLALAIELARSMFGTRAIMSKVARGLLSGGKKRK